MSDILDIRTISFTNLLFMYLYGVGLCVYGHNHRIFSGISTIGCGFLVMGLGFMLLGLRQYIHDFFSIVIANTMIVLGMVFVYEGLIKFRNATFNTGRQIAFAMVIVLATSFHYFTFYNPNVNYRIVIISLCIAAVCCLICYSLLCKRHQKETNTAHFLIIWFYASFALVMLVRAWLAFFEDSITDFMQAGTIHGIAVLSFQTLVLLTSFMVVWMASTELEQELKMQARIDPLTNLYNRRALDEAANIEMSRSLRNKHKFSVIMCDIDHFKNINDRYGHQVGDQVLIDFALILKLNVREHDLVARYGGEEFIVMLTETGLQQAAKIAEKLRQNVIEHQFESDKGEKLPISASFGVAIFHDNYGHWNKMVADADQALYKAKKAGRNCVMVSQL